MGKIAGSSRSGKFEFCDFTQGALPGGITRAAVEKEIHVLGGDGRLYKNADAILKILEEYRGWGWLSLARKFSLTRRWLCRSYDFIAARRKRFLFSHAHRVFHGNESGGFTEPGERVVV